MNGHRDRARTARAMPVGSAGGRLAGMLMVTLAAAFGSGAPWAQDASPRDRMLAAVAAHSPADAAPAPGHWDLPRLFYEPRERRGLDSQDRALRSGIKNTPAPTAGPRFDGWLAGPTGTHAWVSGTGYLADPTGHLRRAPEKDSAADTLDMDTAGTHFDGTRGVLVVRRASEGTTQLRVGESDNGLGAGSAAIDAAHPVTAPERR